MSDLDTFEAASEEDPPGDPNTVERMFDRLVDLNADQRRAALIEANLDDDARLLLDRLLAHYDRTEAGISVQGMPASDPTLPESVGPYRIREVLGAGGMGVVYRAEQRKPRRDVAVKVMHPGYLRTRGLRRFELEAELLGRLQHAGIARIIDAHNGGDGQPPYLAMEYVEGETLLQHAHEQGLGKEQRIELLIEIAEAVNHAHMRGVIHRDLKPSNILITKAGEAKVIDFGIARELDVDPEHSRNTRTGDLIGTLAYMSPEQVQGDSAAIDARTDVYSLGVLAYELLTDCLPIDLAGLSLTEAGRRVLNVDPPRLGKHRPALRGDLEWVVARALEKEPGRRYQSADALARDLRRTLEHEPVEARPASALYHLRKVARRHRSWIAGGVATLVAILVGAGISIWFAIQNGRLAERERQASAAARASALEAIENEGLAREQAQLAAAREVQANEALTLAQRRADDLERVANFRLNQLRFIDLPAFGRVVQDALAEQLGKGAPPAFLPRLRGINPMDLALPVIKRGLLDRSLGAVEREFAGSPKLHVQMLIAHGTLLYQMGYLEDAEQVLGRAAARAPSEEVLPNVVGAAILRSSVLVSLNRHEEAELLLRPALDALRGGAHLDPDVVTMALSTQARIASWHGDLDSAIGLFQQLLDRTVDVAVEGDEVSVYDRLVALTNLSIALLANGQVDEVEGLFAEADGYLAELQDPPLHHQTLVLRLGYEWSSAAGNLELAESLVRDAIELSRQANGSENPTTLDFIWRLAMVLHRQGAYAEATDRIEQVLDTAPELMASEAEVRAGLLSMTRDCVEEGEPQASRLAWRALRVAELAHGPTSAEILEPAELLLRAWEQSAHDEAECDALRRRIQDLRGGL